MSRYDTARISRRGLLAAGGGLSLTALLGGLAGCGGSSDSDSDALTILLPGNVPTGWDAVLSKVNAQLKTDCGFTINPQFISWSNYSDQCLLKFTAGEKFDTALQARWLNMTQLVSSESLVAVDSLLNSGNYPNLTATLDTTLLDSNRWSGNLYGIPQVNSAGRIQHFVIRQDLADQVGISEITDYATLEKFWYDVKQKVSGVTPMGLNSNMTNLTIVSNPIGLFNEYSWEYPSTVSQYFNGNSMYFVFDANAAQTGSSNPVPFWEAPGIVDALRKVRQYYVDGIINSDALNVDANTQKSLFASGKQASAWAMTDGTSSSYYLPLLGEADPNATLANIIPLRGGKSAKPNQNFQAENFVVLNVKGASNERAMKLEDWLSIKANHDLISYGIEGTDWNPVGDDSLDQLTDYSFPGYGLCWRSSLERRSQMMSESEADWFAWAQDYNNFTTDPFASFIPDVSPVEREDSQMASVFTQYANPLFFGVVDVDEGLDDLKKAIDDAGLDTVQAEMAKQADAYLASKK